MGEFGEASQRVASLVGLPALLAEFGCTIDDLLADLPVAAAAFDSDDTRIPYRVVCQVLDRAAEATRCPHLGLLLGSRFDHGCMGLAGKWMANAPTLEAALTGFIELQSSATRAATAFLHRTGEHYIFGYGVFDPKALGYVQNYSVTIAMALNIVKRLTGRKAKVVEVLFSFRKPPDTRPYQEVFGVPVHFDQTESGIVITESSLVLPVVGASAVDFAEMQKLAASITPPSATPWSDRVRRVLRRGVFRGHTRAEVVAGDLGLHPRALRRHMAAEGTTFKDLLAHVRFGAAKELLAVTSLPAGDIAAALGYSNQPAFQHAFREWSGTTPSKWRQDWLAGYRR